VPATPQLRRALVLALTGGSLAVGVPVALAASNGGDAAPASSSGAPAFIQEESQPGSAQDDQGGARPDRGDCPEHDGGGNGGSGQGGSAEDGSAGSGSATPTPNL
jgi:hypothetical protein